MKVDIPEVPPSLNKVLRMHWAVKRDLAGNWERWIWGMFPHNGNRWHNKKKKVSFTLHHSRLYDKDNAYGACKVVVDAMKRCGFIVDDTAEWLELSVEQQKCPHKQRHTVIEVADV